MSQNPYAAPQSSVEDLHTRVRPRMVTALVGLYLAAYPFFVARVAMGGRMQPFMVVLYVTLVGVYVALVARGLLKGQQWARVMVWLFTVFWVMSVFMSLAQVGLHARVVVMLVEVMLKVAASCMLFMLPAREWFSRTRS